MKSFFFVSPLLYSRRVCGRVLVWMRAMTDLEFGIFAPRSSPSCDPCRVCEALGCVTYKSQNGLVVAQQCEDGGIWFQGERYTGIRDWLRRCFSKKI